MSFRIACLVLVVLSIAFWGPRASAETRPTRAAFAVVIGNNRSLEHRRPDLHYADDDAAKYFGILETIAKERAFLLTEFDDDTARLFPAARARALPPTKDELLRVGREIGEAVRSAASEGMETEVYFVFAGHGDVDEARGFIELADARFTAADLEAWLRAIPFSRAHVILDSCNSFFMLGERRPGGRYYATSEDAARTLSSRLPNVGVFLSTSAEGESFEWSEIQSGVFSHVVRSGLLGAADADGDGNVSYAELAAFVATATMDVANPNMRPHVFARGPGGHSDRPILSVARRAGARLFRLPSATAMRVRLRDRESVPILDAHQEAGLGLTFTVPEAWAEGAVLTRAATDAAGRELESFLVPPPETEDVTLASLTPIAARGAVRGPAEIFQRLFVHPFGPRALLRYRAESESAPTEVYGVSREEAERLTLLLGQIESAERGRRLTGGTMALGVAALYGTIGATLFAYDDGFAQTSRAAARTSGAIFLGGGALALATGVYYLAQPWAGERLASEYRDSLAKADYAHAFALANERIEALAKSEARDRWVRGIAGGLVASVGALIIAQNELAQPSADERLEFRALGGAAILLGAASMASSLLLGTPVEALTTTWRGDPARLRIQPVAAPTEAGAIFGLRGSF